MDNAAGRSRLKILVSFLYRDLCTAIGVFTEKQGVVDAFFNLVVTQTIPSL